MSHSFKYSTRLNSFKARPDLYNWRTGPHSTLDLIERAACVSQLDSVELNYPEHFIKHTPAEVRTFIENTHLTVSGINLRYDAPRFLDGGFTNPQAEKRAEAIQVTREATQVCRKLDAIAAAAVGGTSMSGGRGNIPGTILGALILGALRNGLTLMNVQAFYQLLATGIIILVAVTVDRFTRGKR